MKKDIHPKYEKTVVTCASCGNKFEVRSTQPEITVEICNKCHPFYTGKQGNTAKTGNVEKFNKRYGKKA